MNKSDIVITPGQTVMQGFINNPNNNNYAIYFHK